MSMYVGCPSFMQKVQQWAKKFLIVLCLNRDPIYSFGNVIQVPFEEHFNLQCPIIHVEGTTWRWSFLISVLIGTPYTRSTLYPISIWGTLLSAMSIIYAEGTTRGKEGQTEPHKKYRVERERGFRGFRRLRRKERPDRPLSPNPWKKKKQKKQQGWD